MTLKNTPERWGAVSQSLHWLIVILLLVIAYIGLTMGDLPNGPRKNRETPNAMGRIANGTSTSHPPTRAMIARNSSMKGRISFAAIRRMRSSRTATPSRRVSAGCASGASAPRCRR